VGFIVCIQNWNAKLNKTIDFLFGKFILKHFFSGNFPAMPCDEAMSPVKASYIMFSLGKAVGLYWRLA